MAWLRIDDGFTSHPKFAGWSVADRWALLELMSYCARYKTGGKIPEDLTILPRKIGARLVKKAEDSGWIETRSEGKFFHDWDVYNPADPTAAKRMAAYRHRNADRNDGRNIDRNDGVTVTPPRARARARVPVPSPEREINLSLTRVTVGEAEEALRAAEIEEASRVQAWVDRSREPDVRSPSAFLRAGVQSGEWPDPFATADERPVNGPVTVERCPECDCSPPAHAEWCSLK